MRFFKKKSGITLVALVVTIVVLLILAGITIAMLFGQNGIITSALKAKEETENAQANDLEGIQNLEDEMKVALGAAPKAKQGEIVTAKYATYSDTDSDGNTQTAVIPCGYAVVKDEKNTIENGLVISDKAGDDMNNSDGDNKGNQFVWVPVPDVSAMYGTDRRGNKLGKLYNFSSSGITNNNWTETDGVMSWTSSTSYREPDIVGDPDGTGTSYDRNSAFLSILGKSNGSEFKIELQNSFDAMIESVSTYGGFYIGRYETGNLAADTTTTPVVQKGRTDINNVNWYYMYVNSKKIAANSNVTTSMIWGCQWDAVMTWMYNSKDSAVKIYTYDSTGKGNYSGTQGDTDTIIPTGSNPNYAVNNIYDMSGNVMDWTIETTYTFARVVRRRPLRLCQF